MLTRLLGRTAPRDDERGLTVIEVTTVMALLTLVMGAIFGTLTSLTENERRSQALVANEQSVRFVLTDMAREIRAANPMDVLSTTSKSVYNNSLQVELGPGPTKTVVRWVYDTNPTSSTYQTITRQVMSNNTTSATVVSSRIVLRRVRNVESGNPLFRYFGQSGQNLVTSPSATAGDVGNCTIRVRVRVTSDSNPGPQPFTETLDVYLRNRLPGGLGCG